MYKSGFIGIIGRPNVGKSSLLNFIMGEKIAITTHKPQTTRNRIRGIKNLQDPQPGQLIFIDTPGIHRPSTRLNEIMVGEALETASQVDILLFVTEAKEAVHRHDLSIIESWKNVSRPVILVINKIDLLADKKLLLPVIDQFQHLFPFKEIIPLNALKGEGVEILIKEICELLPEGPQHFPDDLFTDQTERFLVAEVIREKITLLTHQEVPYAAAVVVESFKEDEERNFIHLHAVINVEKDSQKGIIIGKQGTMLREIGRRARLDLERFFAAKIYLELFVKVRKDWSNNPQALRELGYEAKRTKKV